MAGENYTTLVTARSTKALKTLSAKARAQKQGAIKSQANMNERYGQAMSSVTAQAYKPLMARVQAGVAAAQSRVAQGKAGEEALAGSNAVFAQAGAAQQTGYEELMARTEAGAMPGIISARSAMQSAKAAATSAGLDIKRMNWAAKADLFGQVIAQNNAMVMAKYQQQLELDTQERLIAMQQAAAADAALQGSSLVVSNVNNAMPSLLSEVAGAKPGDKDLGAQATAWAASQTTDQTAQAVLAQVYMTIANGAAAHTVNGSLNGEWVRQQVVAAVHNQYPSYTADTNIESALSNGVLSAGLSPSTLGSSEGVGQPNGFYMDFMQGATNPRTPFYDNNRAERLGWLLGGIVPG